MLDIIPWFDETYIVEMGRLFLCGGDPENILLGRMDVVMVPWHYVAPVIQEVAFRLLGQTGVRLSPFLGLFVAWFSFRHLILKTTSLTGPARELTALLVPTSPLLFQSVILARPDVWPISFTLAAIAVLGTPDVLRSRARIFLGAFLAVLAVFSWPSSILSALIFPAFCFDRKGWRDFVFFSLAAVVSAILLSLPLLPQLQLVIDAFVQHSRDTAPSAISPLNLVATLSREVARAPFHALVFCSGILLWIVNRRWLMVFALLFAFVLGIKTGLYAFRLVYLTPLVALLWADLANWLYAAKRKKFLLFGLFLSVGYGVVTGPIGQFFIDYPKLPTNLKADLEQTIGRGPHLVFAPDFATYYIGRELGWRQVGFADPANCSDPELINKLTARAEVAVLRDYDPYEPIQQSFTPYGLFCKYVLQRAKAEEKLSDRQKSWAARFGSHFAGSWHAPIRLPDFEECATFGPIHVYRRRP